MFVFLYSAFYIFIIVKVTRLQCLIRLATDFRGGVFFSFPNPTVVLFSVLLRSMKPLSFSQPQRTESLLVTSVIKLQVVQVQKGKIAALHFISDIYLLKICYF